MEQKFSDNMHISIYLNLFMGRPVNARRKQKPETYTVSSIKMMKTCNAMGLAIDQFQREHISIFSIIAHMLTWLVGWLVEDLVHPLT